MKQFKVSRLGNPTTVEAMTAVDTGEHYLYVWTPRGGGELSIKQARRLRDWLDLWLQEQTNRAAEETA